MTELRRYANYIAAANKAFAEGFTGETDIEKAVVAFETPLVGLESPLIDPDPEEGIRVALSAPIAGTKNGVGYLQILVHLFNVNDEGGTFPADVHNAVRGFDNFQFKIGGGPAHAKAKLTRAAQFITEDMIVFAGNNKVGAWLKDRYAKPINASGIITGFQWSKVAPGPYRISLLSFAIGNSKFNDEFDGVAGTNSHHAETWPNTPYIDVVV